MTATNAPESHSSEAHVELRDVWLAFGNRPVMRGLNCSFPRGRVSVLMGGSGSGKSTLLRVIAGLVSPDSGSVLVAGHQVVGRSESELASVRVRIGMLFQNGALLDSMSVFDNIALPLRERTGKSEAQIRDEVHRRLAAVGLEDVDDLLPGELSGGMLKRAALARAIILDPEILLCDEPFSGLDPPNVLRIEALLARLAGELGLTVIVTSHHVVTSRRMANQLMVLFPDGAVSGTPQELAMSRDPRINEFLGVQPEAETAGSDAGSTQPHLELG